MSLDDANLSFMEQTQSLLMPDLAAISELVRAPDDRGGFTETWVAQPTSQPCRIGAPTAAELRQIQGRLDLSEAWAVTLPVAADVREGYRLTIGGQVYEVSVKIPPANWQTAVRLIVRRA